MAKNALDGAVESVVLQGVFGAGHGMIVSMMVMVLLSAGIEWQRLRTMPPGGWRKPAVPASVTDLTSEAEASAPPTIPREDPVPGRSPRPGTGVPARPSPAASTAPASPVAANPSSAAASPAASTAPASPVAASLSLAAASPGAGETHAPASSIPGDGLPASPVAPASPHVPRPVPRAPASPAPSPAAAPSASPGGVLPGRVGDSPDPDVTSVTPRPPASPAALQVAELVPSPAPPNSAGSLDIDDLDLPPPESSVPAVKPPVEVSEAWDHLAAAEVTEITPDLLDMGAALAARHVASVPRSHFGLQARVGGPAGKTLELLMRLLGEDVSAVPEIERLPPLNVLREGLTVAERKRVLESVIRNGSPAARKALLADLDTEILPVEPALGSALATLLGSGDRKIKSAAAGLLSRSTDRSLSTVLTAVLPKLTGPDRFAVLRALTAQGSTDHVSELKRGLASQDNDERAHCLHALASQASDPDAILAVEGSLEDSDFMVRQGAVHVLLEEGDTRAHEAMLTDLASPLPRTRLEALRTLADLSERSRSREILGLLKSKEAPAEVRKQMLGLLAACPDRGATRPLLGLIAHSSENVRRAVIENLAPSQVEELAQALVERLGAEKSVPVRLAIARCLLTSARASDAVKSLLALAKEDATTKEEVARVLGHHSPDPIAALVEPEPAGARPRWWLTARLRMPRK